MNNSLTNVAVDIEPSHIGWTVTSSQIQEFVEKLLLAKKIEGVEGVRLIVRREGAQSPDVAVWLYISNRSSDVNPSSTNNIANNAFTRRMQDNTTKISDKLRQTLELLVKVSDDDQSIKVGRDKDTGFFVCKLDIHKIFAMMFKSDYRTNEVVIVNISKTGKSGCNILAMKQYRKNSKTANSEDRLTASATRLTRAD